ncbi:snoaL-like polyketide cyclase [Colletotrichum tofieldiae]|uniref:SnoaL-like polyketide cyclase n=1 Tax=Colletotrichum tofieldiae TaxID=708197 RepID=A0A166VAC6_9PEZI|nr:SnoaL-like polyketide cyclase [Colletotrichum tofieldiae]GKT64345.1 SnoaL-like polyketide cyclase [Colletotrichum tofieldiae]GKT74318.1 snoaL-like polyketide cyclase [Colletotrichum tofieldiae]GKT91497.1 snoaL-like polyketide cyclase [Colletotrichum tofieldiae]
MDEYEAPCFSHESMLTPPESPEHKAPEFPGLAGLKPPVAAAANEPHRKSRSPSSKRWNGDGKGIQVDIGARLREYLDCLNNRKFDVIGNHLADTLERNNRTQTREEHIDRLRSRVEGLATFQIKIDTLLVDKKAKAVAVRYVNRVTLANAMMWVDTVGKTYEFDEQCFVWFDDKGKIARMLTLQDNDGIRRQTPEAGVTPRFFTRSTLEEPVDLAAVYRKYVASINHGTMSEDFPRYCKSEVRHNNRVMPVEEYWCGMAASQEAISGLRFEIQELLVDEETQQVAARLQITGTPVSEFAGARPNGKSVKFHEHCMYRFDKGKIALVWATMELDSYRKQLEEKSDRRKSSMLGIN